MMQPGEWTIIVIFVNKKSREHSQIKTRVIGTLDDAKRKSRKAFKSTKTARIASIKIVGKEMT